MISMFHALITPGSTSAHTVSIRPSLCTVRKVGTKPPEKSMVKVNRNVMPLRAPKVFCESGKAAMMVITR